MNRIHTSPKLLDDDQENKMISHFTVQSAAKMMFLNDKENTSKAMKKPTLEQLRMEAVDPVKQKERRVLGLKRHASPPRRPSDDLRYRTTHPKKIDVRDIAGNGNKKSKLGQELTKQELMIKNQGQDVTKKYQLLHSGLGELLRSTSDGTGTSSSGSDSPGNAVTLSA